MSSFDWFRSWHGAPTDHKWAVIAKRANTVPGVVSAIIWALLDYASQNKDRGSIAGFDAETYATFSGFPEETVNLVMAALKDKGVITPADRFNKWEERQPKRDDDSAPRVRRFREKQKDVTQCNEDVTFSLLSSSSSLNLNSDSDSDSLREDLFEGIVTPEDSCPSGNSSSKQTIVPPAVSLRPETVALRLFSEVTGLVSPPSQDVDRCIETILRINDHFRDFKSTRAHMVGWWSWWKAQRTKDGQPYSVTNTAWLNEKAITGAPPPAVNHAPPEKSKAERRKEMAKLLGVNP